MPKGGQRSVLQPECIDWWRSSCLMITLFARISKRIRSEAVSELVQYEPIPVLLGNSKHKKRRMCSAFTDLVVVRFNKNMAEWRSGSYCLCREPQLTQNRSKSKSCTLFSKLYTKFCPVDLPYISRIKLSTNGTFLALLYCRSSEGNNFSSFETRCEVIRSDAAVHVSCFNRRKWAHKRLPEKGAVSCYAQL